jgi:hypothetical protein
MTWVELFKDPCFLLFLLILVGGIISGVVKIVAILRGVIQIPSDPD